MHPVERRIGGRALLNPASTSGEVAGRGPETRTANRARVSTYETWTPTDIECRGVSNIRSTRYIAVTTRTASPFVRYDSI